MFFFLRCNGAHVYSIVRESKKEVNNGALTAAINFTKFDPLAGGMELTSPSPRILPALGPFQPRTQHTHILFLSLIHISEPTRPY